MKDLSLKQFFISFMGLIISSSILIVASKLDWINTLNVIMGWLPIETLDVCINATDLEYGCYEKRLLVMNFITLPFSIIVSGSICAYWANKLTKHNAKKYLFCTVALTAPFPIYLFIFPFVGLSMDVFFMATWFCCILISVFVGHLNYEQHKHR